MKIFIRCLACGFLLALSAGRAFSAEAFLLIRVSDMTRESAFQVMSADEFKQFQKQLQQEERFFQKALSQAAEEWRQDEMNKSTPFPAAKVVSRKIIGQPEKFTDQEKAEERLGLYEDRESRKRLRESEKSKKNPSDAEKAKMDREIDKQLLVRRAADLVAVKLSALTGIEIAAPADPFAAKDEEKAADVKKADEKAPEVKKAP